MGPKSARGKQDDARLLVTDNIDPAEHRIFTKSAQIESAANSFESVTREWYAKYDPAWSLNDTNRILRRLERDVFPSVGKDPVTEITTPVLLTSYTPYRLLRSRFISVFVCAIDYFCCVPD